MTLQGQLRWGGLWILVVSLLFSVTNIMVYAGRHNAAIQAAYFAGYTGLILTCTIIHIAQARRAGVFGLVAYLLSLKQNVNLFEAPMYAPKTNAVNGATNAVEAAANGEKK